MSESVDSSEVLDELLAPVWRAADIAFLGVLAAVWAGTYYTMGLSRVAVLLYVAGFVGAFLCGLVAAIVTFVTTFMVDVDVSTA